MSMSAILTYNIFCLFICKFEVIFSILYIAEQLVFRFCADKNVKENNEIVSVVRETNVQHSGLFYIRFLNCYRLLNILI